MRVLVAMAEPPAVEGGAPGRGAVALLRGLRARGVDVVAVAARGPRHRGDVPADLECTVVETGPPPAPKGRRAQWARPLDDLDRGPFGATVRRLAGDVDVVHLDTADTGWCAEGLHRPATLHLHYRARLDHRPSLLSAPGRRSLWLDRRERAVARLGASLVASSPRVAASLAGGDRAITTIPFGLDPTDYPVADHSGPPTAVLVGTGSWPATAGALDRLVRRVWPRVRRVVPRARLIVAGRGTQAWRANAGEGVEVLGPVDSAIEVLAGSSVLLHPSPPGSGVKVKVLEALACGLPVVTTPWGAEGVATPGAIQVAWDDDELAAAAAALLEDPDERRRRGALGRRAIEQHHSPVASTGPLVGLLERVAERR